VSILLTVLRYRSGEGLTVRFPVGDDIGAAIGRLRSSAGILLKSMDGKPEMDEDARAGWALGWVTPRGCCCCGRTDVDADLLPCDGWNGLAFAENWGVLVKAYGATGPV
jgi:hypothetical protein